MSKSQKKLGTTVFYKFPSVATEIRSGYLLKSPPQKYLRTENSWKKRYFVLYKISEGEYHLKYFRSPEQKDSPCGGIDLSKISLLHLTPENHQKWGCVHKTIKCSSAHVLYIRAARRDYFLVGETSEEVDGWFDSLVDVLQKLPNEHFNSEEKSNGQTAEVPELSTGQMGPNRHRRFMFPPPPTKNRSMSAPCPDVLDKAKDEDHYKRFSVPLPQIYDYPESFLMLKGDKGKAACTSSMDSIYEMMETSLDISEYDLGKITSDSLERSVAQVYEKLKTQNSPVSPFAEEAAAENSEDKRDSTDFSSSSSGTISPAETLEVLMPKCNGRVTSEEREFDVNLADLKKHLKLTEVDGRPSVSGWTGQPETECLFHKGDLILAINDLHTSSMEDFNLFISRSLKNEVKLTILRQRGQQPLHLPNIPCSG